MLSTITVSNTADTGPGTLRAAIEQANLDSAQDTIDFAPSVTGTITLSTALPALSASMNIVGPVPSDLTVARSSALGTPLFNIFTVSAGAQVAISGLTITGGRGGVFVFGTFTATLGGGIANAGTLTVTNSTISGNSVPEWGGGINNLGTLTVTNSTISGNSAGAGGGIENGGTLIVTNSTISGNSADQGGGIQNGDILTVTIPPISNTVTLTNSTISGNSDDQGGGSIDSSGGAGTTLTVTNCTISGNSAIGINSGSTLTVTYSTISGNSGVGIQFDFDLPGVALTAMDSLFSANLGGSLTIFDNGVLSLNHNLFSDAPGVALDPTNLIDTDPLLGPLANNGGPTLTQALLPGSPAIDAGVAVPGVTSDQRGVPRPQGSAPDIGAFESRGFVVSVVSGADQRTQVGSAFPATLVVAVVSPFGEPVAGGLVTFTAPATGAAADFVGNPAIIDASGQASLTASANGYSGNYSVTVGAGGGGNVAFSLTNVGDPKVVSLRRFGFHDHPTLLVLTFSEPMYSAQADNLGNYRLVAAGTDLRPGVEDGRAIRIRRALYDAASQTVTLWPIRRLKLRRTFLLTVVGTPPGGLTNASGVFLDGAGTGQPGSDYMGIVNRKSLAGQTGRPQAPRNVPEAGRGS
jgi:hypothetical protein